jgi:hypothetical protein
MRDLLGVACFDMSGILAALLSPRLHDSGKDAFGAAATLKIVLAAFLPGIIREIHARVQKQGRKGSRK